MIYNYPIHYLYDILVLLMNILLARQVFNLNLTKYQPVLFVAWVMVFYQINFYIIEPNFPKEYKYIILYIGLLTAYYFIAKLSFIASLIILMCSTAFNGFMTNMNLLFMLRFLFPNYGAALEAQHLQYTCYTFTVVLICFLSILFKVKFFDIQKYS